MAVGPLAAGFSAPSKQALPEPVTTEAGPEVALSVAYFGEFATHPGAVVALELPLAGASHDLHAVGQLGGYVHPRNHLGAFIIGGLGYRLTLGPKIWLDLGFGGGYLHTLLSGDVYEPAADGSVAKTTDFGRPTIMPLGSLGVGYVLEKVEGSKSSVFGRLVGFGQYPINAMTLFHPALEIGIRWALK